MDKRIRDYYSPVILEKACAVFAVKPSDIRELGGFESFIYEFTQDAVEYILRITHSSRRSAEQIEAEMEFIEYLHENGIACSRVCLSQGGKMVEAVTDGKETFLVAAFTKVPGSRLKKIDDNAEFRYNYGKLLGKMHKLTKQFKPFNSKRDEWYESSHFVNFAQILPENNDLVIEKFKQNMLSIQQIPKNIDNYGLIHYDAHPGNFLVQNQQLYIFDFDDSLYHFFIADIAVILFTFASYCPPDCSIETFISDFFPQFMQGYLSENYLSETEISHLPHFLKQREFLLYVALHQAFDESELANIKYMSGRREKLENDTPFLNLDFTKIVI